ncbi:MAG: hypothetical protein H8D56_13385 [Planctomycetes bacterium]|nr:hypothetical protein [Planctomycetota bacterium]MBL7145629.1 hypothetical protein [Phycisphaerae bacterium]
MLADRLNKDDKFDEMLGRTLRSSSQAVPSDFTRKMLSQIRQAEEQKILARVVLQERLALAGCFALGAAAIIAMVVFPDTITAVFHSIVGSFTAQSSTLVSRIPQSINTVRDQWQLFTILAAMLGFAVYSLLDLMAGDRLKTV